MGLNRRKLKDWATRLLLRQPPALRFSVYHISRHAPALVLQISADGTAEDKAAAIERSTADEVTDHVEAWPGRQQYYVQAFGADDEDYGQFAFSMAARGNGAGADMMVAPPEHDPHMPFDASQHPHALVTVQQMRHNEGLVHALVQQSRAAAERDAEIIAGQQRHIDQMEERRIDFWQMIENMHSQKQERELQSANLTAENDRKEKLMKMITGFVIPEMARRSGVKLPGDVQEKIKGIIMQLPAETHELIMEQLPEKARDELLQFMEGKQEQEATKH